MNKFTKLSSLAALALLTGCGGGGGGGSPIAPTPSEYTLTVLERQTIGTAGGTLTSGNKQLTFAANALTANKEVVLNKVNYTNAPSGQIGDIVDIVDSEGNPITLNGNLEIQLDYNDSDSDIRLESKLAIYRWENNAWTLVGTPTVDANANTVKTTISDHTSFYAVRQQANVQPTISNFQVTPTSCEAPCDVTVSFDVSDDGTIQSQQVNYGDGFTNDLTKTLSSVDEYHIDVKIVGDEGEIVTFEDQGIVNVVQSLTVSAEVNDYSINVGDNTILTCSVNGSYTTLEARCDTTLDWQTITGTTLTCSYTEAGDYYPGCKVDGSETANVIEEVDVNSAAVNVYADVDKETAFTNETVTLTCDTDGDSYTTLEARCEETDAWTTITGITKECVYTTVGNHYPGCRVDSDDIDDDRVEIIASGIIATYDIENLLIGESTTLTCTTNGPFTSLEGRCDSADSWTAITSGNTMSCSYSIAGEYYPGCRLDGTTIDEVDQDIDVSAPIDVDISLDKYEAYVNETITVTCSTDDTIVTLEGKCKQADSYTTLTGNAFECTFDTAGEYEPSCLLNSIETDSDEVDINNLPTVTASLNDYSILTTDDSILYCLPAGTYTSLEARCDDSDSWTTVIDTLTCSYSEGSYQPGCQVNGSISDDVDQDLVVTLPPAVSASVDDSDVDVNDDVTLTCATEGIISTLEGRCDDSDAYETLTGNTKTCNYDTEGSYTPGCQINGDTTDNVDSDVNVTDPNARTLSGKLTTTILIPAGADTKYPGGLSQDQGLEDWEVLVFSEGQITNNPATDGIDDLFLLTPVATGTTNVNGEWSVSGLAPGTYHVWLRDEDNNYQMGQGICTRDGGTNKFSLVCLDDLNKLGWTDILFKDLDANSGNLIDLNEQPIPNLLAAYGLDQEYHPSFAELVGWMGNIRPWCDLYGDGGGNSTCVAGTTYGLLAQLVRVKDVPAPINCGDYNNGTVDYDEKCGLAWPNWNLKMNEWRTVDGFRLFDGGDAAERIVNMYFNSSTLDKITYNQDTENFLTDVEVWVMNNLLDGDWVQRKYEHELMSVMGAINNSYIGISSGSTQDILAIEGAFAAISMGRVESVTNGLIKPVTGYSNDFAGVYYGRMLIQ
ncbi:hypothetical protein ACFL1H_05410 [Nanoarchaeota archaeon]